MGFPLPPITDFRFTLRDANGKFLAERYANPEGLATMRADFEAKQHEIEGSTLILEGRRRMNDYVGSPQWGPWCLIVEEVRA